MEAELQTKIQTFSQNKLHGTHTGQEIINTEKLKLHDAISQARKSEAVIREESRLQIDTFVAQNDYEIQQIRDTIVSYLY